jgi:hypothetical protein
MRWKVLISVFLIPLITFAFSLTELLDITEHEVTKYEAQGLANEHPYHYTKLKEYYRYGKLFASYLFIKESEQMLNLALYSVNPIGKPPRNYFLNHLELNYYLKAKKEIPIVLAKVETAFNAYIGWSLATSSEKKEYKTLEYLIKDRFLQNWTGFLKVAPKPVFFLIPKWLTQPQDKHFLWLLNLSYNQGWIKKIVVATDKETLKRLEEEKLLPPNIKTEIIEDKKYIHCLVY